MFSTMIVSAFHQPGSDHLMAYIYLVGGVVLIQGSTLVTFSFRAHSRKVYILEYYETL